jgi:hypothetical protein
MGLFRRWLERRNEKRAERALEREARRALAAIFDVPSRLQGTSLRPEHRGRVQLARVEAESGRVVRVFFTIIRHPRPYAFSKQVHEVLELWRLDVHSGALERVEGANLSRLRGSDGEPGAHGAGV